MIVGDNKLISLFNYTFETLQGLFPEQEAKNISLLLFDFYLNKSRTDLVIQGNEKLSESEILKIHFAIKRLKLNEPVQYIMGETEFYGLRFLVNPSVLIPRPETEELVQWIVEDNSKKQVLQILDIGTGSGCIPIALKSKLTKAEIFGCDISEEAIEIAKLNSKDLHQIVRFFQLDILQEDIKLQDLDIIVSNPPYIPLKDKETMDANVLDFEPSVALFVDNEDPFVFYKRIAEIGLKTLKPKGKLYFEIHKDFASEVGEILFDLDYINIEIKKDISSNDRMIKAQKK